MDHIVFDESGKLLSGIFYEFDVQLTDDLSTLADKPDATWIVSSRNPTDDELSLKDREPWMRTQVLPEEDDWLIERPCRVSRSHIRKCRLKSAHADLFGGRRLSDFYFLPDSAYDKIVVTEAFAARLKKTGLTGMQFIPLKINVNQSGRMPDPKLFVLESTARHCLRPLKVQGVKNACPFCGRKPLICPECGYNPLPCPGCNKIPYIGSHLHEGPGDRRLKSNALVPKAGWILEGSKWDGSDFINCGRYFITKRALDWLLSIHAAPFYVRPARVNVEGLSKEQLAKLEAAKKPLPAKKSK